MRITVVGAGRVGTALASAFVRVGHEVHVVTRSQRPVPEGTTASPGGSVRDADLTVLAVPFEAVSEAVAQMAPTEAGVIVDATNPFGGFRPVLPVAGTTPAARALVRDLAEDIGFDAIDVGGLGAAGALESAALYWGLLAGAGGRGRQLGLVALTREAG